MMWSMFFFFQAEDGIRDLVRSRGLGDVYKRQVQQHEGVVGRANALERVDQAQLLAQLAAGVEAQPVSYTHLTLPTSDLV